MRIRTMAGLTAAGAAAVAAVIGGVTYASADEEPIVRIVTDETAGTSNVVQQEQPQDQQREDCPDETGEAAPSPEGAGL